MSIKVAQLVNNVLSCLDARQQSVIKGRYGLDDGEPKTLAEIGEKYGVTRERVRQIEAGALAALKNHLPKSGAKQFVSLVKSHLKNVGGVRREFLLLEDLSLMIADSKSPHLNNKVHFLLETAGEPKFALEDANVYSYWYLADENKKKANDFIAKLAKNMEKNRHNTTEVVSPHDLKDLVALNFIAISKRFHVNEFGDFGLSNWSEVNPQTMRDWSYVVLKKNKNPLHFTDIAKMINKTRKNAKRTAHPQTVHNELIKDSRFVLVGRGTYGLEEHGYTPGTAREVMARLLKKHGPLKPKELLDAVLKERLFKKNTVFINLQNKKYFKRLEDGRYTTLV